MTNSPRVSRPAEIALAAIMFVAAGCSNGCDEKSPFESSENELDSGIDGGLPSENKNFQRPAQANLDALKRNPFEPPDTITTDDDPDAGQSDLSDAGDDTDPTDDTSPDAGSSDTETETIDTSCTCFDGPCCDGCHMRSASFPCETWTEFRCEGSGCLARAENRTAQKRCSGQTSTCDGPTSLEEWTGTDCSTTNALCQTDNASYAVCAPCDAFQSCDEEHCRCSVCGPSDDRCGAPGNPWLDWNNDIVETDDSLTEIIYATAEMSGTSLSNGSANSEGITYEVGNGIMVGDPGLELESLTMLTFDLEPLQRYDPTVEATLFVHLDSIRGDGPFNSESTSHVIVVQTVYFDIFYAYAEPEIVRAQPSRTLATDASSGYHSVSVTESLRYQLATCQNDLQMRLSFAPDNTDSDGAEDIAVFAGHSSDNPPYLEIVYLP